MKNSFPDTLRTCSIVTSKVELAFQITKLSKFLSSSTRKYFCKPNDKRPLADNDENKLTKSVRVIDVATAFTFDLARTSTGTSKSFFDRAICCF